VNIGDMHGQRLTNTRVSSTTHRVVNPPERTGAAARYSRRSSCNPNPDFVIGRAPLVAFPPGTEPLPGADHRRRAISKSACAEIKLKSDAAGSAAAENAAR
jgi:isopenicillin N synthase-like dioxygenase